MLKAINIPAFVVEEISELPENTVLISINEEEPVELFSLKINRDDLRVLTLRFTDITAKLEQNGLIFSPVNIEQTKQLISFIENNKQSNFIVHCAAGVSRSSAIALFIHLEYGHELRDNFWLLSEPNPFVLGMLIREKHKNIKLND